MGPLAFPAESAAGDHPLREVLNVASNEDYRLLMTWMTAALLPTGPYPVLVVSGQQGSAKSCLVRQVRGLIDPNTAPLRGTPHDARDLVAAARNNHVVAFDNLSSIRPEFADQLCRLATGGGVGGRKLYSDAEEAVFDAQRPIILNGIGELATRGDLAERALVLTLPAIPPTRRRGEQELNETLELALPGIFATTLDALVVGLRRLPEMRLNVKKSQKPLPRMADFALWGMAVAPALGWTETDFLDAYARNNEHAQSVVLENDTVAMALVAFMNVRREWRGTASKLLSALPKPDRFDPTWPNTPNALGQRLSRLAPALKTRGIEIEQARTSRERSWSIRVAEPAATPMLKPVA
jgi:hypothetical protein